MQIQDNTKTCYQRGNRKTRQKISPQPSKSKSIYQRIKLEYMNNKRSSKPSLFHVLEPAKLLLPTDFSESCLHQLSGSYDLTQLHLPLNGSFQCFLKAPKLDSTLRLGVVSVWVKNLSRMQRQRGRSRGKSRGNLSCPKPQKGPKHEKDILKAPIDFSFLTIQSK